MTVIVFDLDGIRALNDEQGHAAGDLLLRAIGERWQPLVRAPDLLVRWGGDEFACLLASGDATAAERVARRLAAACPDGIGVSHGIAVWRPGESLDALFARADEALYADKHAR